MHAPAAPNHDQFSPMDEMLNCLLRATYVCGCLSDRQQSWRDTTVYILDFDSLPDATCDHRGNSIQHFREILAQRMHDGFSIFL
jgi:hypothetical protein